MIPLIIIAGPTAVGKSAVGIELAKQINGEIISADSMQVYRYMNIGTAKISPEEMQGIPHHLIDVCDPTEEFHVYEYQRMAKQALNDIIERGHIPIVVGGTGFYIQALLYDIDFTEHGEMNELRDELMKLSTSSPEGNKLVHDRLAKLDPVSAAAIHPNNVKRVIRAIEYFTQTGQSIMEHNEQERERTSPYKYKYFVLNNDRDILYENIDRRVDIMMEQGLLDEVKSLLSMNIRREMTSMQGIGYKQLLAYLANETSLEEAVSIIKRDSRHYAKRQLTWFNREKNLTWIDRKVNDINSSVDICLKELEDIL